MDGPALPAVQPAGTVSAGDRGLRFYFLIGMVYRWYDGSFRLESVSLGPERMSSTLGRLSNVGGSVS
jgi:hypothetical protein